MQKNPSPAQLLRAATCPPPAALEAIRQTAAQKRFELSCSTETGGVLRALAASKPGGKFLELGTGMGEGAAWLLDGMDAQSRLLSVEMDEDVQAVARKHLGADTRLDLVAVNARTVLVNHAPGSYDLVFADCWLGKMTLLSEALRLVKVGGFYVVDDLLPQPTWPQEMAGALPEFYRELEARPEFRLLNLDWANGLLVAVRQGLETA